MIYSVVKIQVNGLTFSWFGINPFTHLDKGGQNAHPKSPLFQKILENIFLETKKPPIFLEIEVNRRRVELFIFLVYNKKSRERQIRSCKDVFQMTKEERQKYKELTKVLPKMLKDKIKKYKFKKKDFMIWYSTKELFFDLLNNPSSNNRTLDCGAIRLPDLPRVNSSFLSAECYARQSVNNILRTGNSILGGKSSWYSVLKYYR